MNSGSEVDGDKEKSSKLEAVKQDEGEHKNLGCLDSFCSQKFFAFIKTAVKYVFPVVLLLLAIAFGAAASQLQPTSEADQVLRDDHPFQRYIDSSNNDFGVSTDSRMRPVHLVFGLEDPPIDRSELVNRFSREPGVHVELSLLFSTLIMIMPKIIIIHNRLSSLLRLISLLT